MKISKKLGLLAAAVTAVSIAHISHGGDLYWSPGGTIGAEGQGSWDLSSSNWYGFDELSTPYLTPWIQGSNANLGNSAIAGTNAATGYFIDLAAPIIVQDINFGISDVGTTYNISDFGGGNLTINGNLNKAAGVGSPDFFLANGVTLGTGSHVIALNDSPGDGTEMRFDATVGGVGGIELNNGAYQAYGSLAMNQDNTYMGDTVITRGRLIISTSNGLGSTAAGTYVGPYGTLALGGGGVAIATGIGVNEPIQINRTQYTATATDPEFGRYDGAILNYSGNNTISTNVVLNTPIGRLGSYGGTVTFSGNFVPGTDVATSAVAIVVTGNNIGVTNFSGDNTAITGGITLLGGELGVSSDVNLGGPTSSVTFSGGYLRPSGAIVDFGSHVVNTGTFSGGIDNPNSTDVFTIAQNLTGNQINHRGAGTLILSGTNVTTGTTFNDLGVISVTGSTSVGGIRVRNGIDVVSGTLVTTNTYTSVGIDSGESGTLSVTANGVLTAANQDFNISDNPNTTGVFSMNNNARATVAGIFYAGKSTGSNVTLNFTDNASLLTGQGLRFSSATASGGTSTGHLNLSGNATVAVTGTFFAGQSSNGATANSTQATITMSGTTLLTVGGEFQMGNNSGGACAMYMTGGQVVANNWVAVGRSGSRSLLDISGGTFTHQGSNNMYVGESATGVSVMNVHGSGYLNMATGIFYTANTGTGTTNLYENGTINVVSGESWVGQGGGGNGTLNIYDNGTYIVANNWMAIGRGGGTGTVNLMSGTLTKAGSNFLTIGSGGGSFGTLVQTGGALTALSNPTYVGESGTGRLDLEAGTSKFLQLNVGFAGSANGTLIVGGTANVTVGTNGVAGAIQIGSSNSVSGTVVMNGGTLVAGAVLGGKSTGARLFQFNGGTLSITSYAIAGGFTNGGTGTLAPGGSSVVGTSTFAQTYTQGTAATLAVDVAGTNSYDVVTAAASSIINGSVSVSDLGGYIPGSGAMFDIFRVSTGTLTGSPMLTGPDASRYTLSIVNGNTLRLTSAAMALLKGDFNQDQAFNNQDIAGFVQALSDQSGYLAAHPGLTAASLVTLGDFNNDGSFNNQDISGFVMALASGDLSPHEPSVPEPGAMAPALMAGSTLLRRRRRA